MAGFKFIDRINTYEKPATAVCLPVPSLWVLYSANGEQEGGWLGWVRVVGAEIRPHPLFSWG